MTVLSMIVAFVVFISLLSSGLGESINLVLFPINHDNQFVAKCNGPKVAAESYSTSEALMSAKTVFLTQYELTCDSGDDKV